MSKVLCFVTFIGTSVPLISWLARADSEPDMAGLSLMIFCFVGACASLLAYIAGSYMFRRVPSVFNGICTGMIAATVFFTILSLVHKNFDMWLCLILALILSASLAAISPLMGAKNA